MDNKVFLKSMIDALEQMGAKFVKVDYFDIFFDIKIGSEIDNDAKLKRAKDAFMKRFNIGLKIKKIKADEQTKPKK